MKIYFLFLFQIFCFTGCNIISDDPCDESKTDKITVHILADTYVVTTDSVSVPGTKVSCTYVKEKCNGERKGLNTFSGVTDAMGILEGELSTFTLDNYDDVLNITSTVVGGNNSSNFDSKYLTYDSLLDKDTVKVSMTIYIPE